jgi:hypothetical protein
LLIPLRVLEVGVLVLDWVREVAVQVYAIPAAPTPRHQKCQHHETKGQVLQNTSVQLLALLMHASDTEE